MQTILLSIHFQLSLALSLNLIHKKKSLVMQHIENKNEVMVFGHQNSDTDSIVSALVFAEYLRRIKINAKAYCLGDLDNETKFVLQTAGIEQPDMLLDNLSNTTQVALVDHNESEQSIKNLKNIHVKYVIDHHKLGHLTTLEPIFAHIEPVGATATILTKLYLEKHFDIDQKMAILLVSAIISDTLYFRLSSTTDEDRSTINFLLPIAKIDNLENYANQMFAANSNLTGFSMQQILLMGFKLFSFNKQRWGISLLYTIYPNKILEIKDELIKEMFNEKKKSNLTGILFSMVDIYQKQNVMFIIEEPEYTVVRETFNVTIEKQIAILGSRISRKKDIIPYLQEYFNRKLGIYS